MGPHTRWEIWWNVGLRQINSVFPPPACPLKRLLLSIQTLSQLHTHSDEINWLPPAAKATNRGTSIIASSGRAGRQIIPGLSVQQGAIREQGGFNTLLPNSMVVVSHAHMLSNYCLIMVHYLLKNRNHMSLCCKLTVMWERRAEFNTIKRTSLRLHLHVERMFNCSCMKVLS